MKEDGKWWLLYVKKEKHFKKKKKKRKIDTLMKYSEKLNVGCFEK